MKEPVELFNVDTSAELSELASEWILQQSVEILIIADQKAAADSLARQLTLRRGTTVGIHRYSLHGLAGVLAAPELARIDYSPLSRQGRQALTARAISQALRENRLEYFKQVATFPGFARALNRTLEDVRLNSISAVFLSAQGIAGKDLARLLEKYEAELKRQRLADRRLILDLAGRSLQSGRCQLVNKPLLVLNPLLENAAIGEFVTQLAGNSPSVRFILIRDSSESTSCRFDISAITTRNPDQIPKVDWTALLRKRLFSPSLIRDQQSVGDHFQFFSASGEGRECIEIARRIHQQVDSGKRFDEMAVFLREPERYQPLVEEAFRRAGIPAYYSLGTARPDPSGRAFLALLECISEDLSAGRFSEYLSYSQIPDPHLFEEKGDEIPWIHPSDDHQMTFKTVTVRTPSANSDSDQIPAESDVDFIKWEQLIIDASVVGGRDRWERRLRGLHEEYRLKAQRTDDETEKKLFLTRLSQLERLTEFVLPLIGFMDDCPQEATWGKWIELLRELAVRALRRPHSVLEFLAEFNPMSEVGPVSLEEIKNALSDRLSWMRKEPPSSEYGRVYVATLLEARARLFKVVFIPGLAEGILPKRAREDPLWLDQYRRRFTAPIPTRKDRIREERSLLSQAVAAADETLIASYPRIDVTQGRALVPSLYAVELIRAAEGRVPDLKLIDALQAEGAGRLGWPAPKQPSDAVDTAEYDLSWLDILLHDPTDQKRGKGRFLLIQNPWLARSVRFRYKRWQSGWVEEDGLILPEQDPALQDLEGFHPSVYSYSATTLQNFAVCPYRFFLKAITRLQPMDRIERFEKMDPLIRGSLFHEIQFELFEDLQQKGLELSSSTDLNELLHRLDETLDRVESRYRERLAPAITQVWESDIEEIRVDLRVWLKEIAQSASDWKPIHWEYAFGLPLDSEHDSESRSERVLLPDRFGLKGSIDLIVENQKTRHLKVIDHKTGKAATPQPVFLGQGEILQPLLYALAAESSLKTAVESGEFFYCTRRGGFSVYRFPLSQEGREHIKIALQIIRQCIEKGHFPSAPRKGACLYCDYYSVCGPYEEMRVERKPQNRMRGLRLLREMA